MAFNLISEPSEVISLDGCVVFEVNQDSSGSAGVDLRTGAYRLTSGSEELTEIESLPYTGSNEKIEFTRELRSVVGHTFPVIGSTTVFEDTDMVKPYFLDYGESVLDLSDCSNVVTLSGQSNTRYVLNSIMQHYNRASLTSGVVILSDKPSRLPMTPGQNDWLYIYAYSGTINVKVSFYNSSGFVSSVTDPQAFDKNVYVWPIGLGNGFWTSITPPSDLLYYKIEVFDGTDDPGNLVKTYTFFSRDCEIVDNYIEVYFFEPLGGMSGLVFDSVSTQGQVASSLYDNGRECGVSVSSEAMNNGQTRYDFQGFKQYQPSVSIEYTDGLDLYLDAFLNATGHFVKQTLSDGSEIMAKINLQPGSYRTLNDEGTLEFTANFSAHAGVKF